MRTPIYIQIEQALFKEDSDDFIANVTKKPDEIQSLLMVGLEYICQKDDMLFFRKRK